MPGRNSNAGTKELFTGKERDTETGLDYFGARYYDASIGRFLTVDPGLSEFSQARLVASGMLSESPYVYVSNNPLFYIDKDGLVKWRVVGRGAVQLLGGAAGIAISGASLIASGGTASPLAIFGLIASIGVADIGLLNIVAGFADKDSPLPEGLVSTALTEAGVDPKVAKSISLSIDVASLGINAASAGASGYDAIQVLQLILSSESVSSDVKAIIEQKLKEQGEQEQKRAKEEKKRKKEEEKRKKERRKGE